MRAAPRIVTVIAMIFAIVAALAPADKDPTNPGTGTLVTIDGKSWVRNTINACADTTCLSRRFRNGVAVSLNGTLPVHRMERIAATL